MPGRDNLKVQGHRGHGTFEGRPKVEIVVTPTDDHRSYHVSSDKISRELGYRPRRTVEDAIVGLNQAFIAGKVPNSMTATDTTTSSACSAQAPMPKHRPPKVSRENGSVPQPCGLASISKTTRSSAIADVFLSAAKDRRLIEPHGESYSKQASRSATPYACCPTVRSCGSACEALCMVGAIAAPPMFEGVDRFLKRCPYSRAHHIHRRPGTQYGALRS